MERFQKVNKVELINKLANTLKDQFVRLNYAIMAIENISDELKAKECIHKSLIGNKNTDCIFYEMNDSFHELIDFYTQYPMCFDERETEILSEIVEVMDNAGEHLTDNEANMITDLQCMLFEYYNGCEEELEEDLPF